MDPVVAASIIGPLIALAGVLGTAVFVAIRRHGGEEGEGKREQSPPTTSEEVVTRLVDALTAKDDLVSNLLVSHERMAGTLDRISDQLTRMDEAHIAALNRMDENHTAAIQRMDEAHRAEGERLRKGQDELVDIHREMKMRRELLRELLREEEKKDDGGHHS